MPHRNNSVSETAVATEYDIMSSVSALHLTISGRGKKSITLFTSDLFTHVIVEGIKPNQSLIGLESAT